MKIIAGLGNFGREYAGTRHNMGFDTVTALSDRLRVPLDTKKFKGLCGFGYIGGEKVVLVQPQTYMNNSGECIRAILDFFKLTAQDIIIICDDISLEPGMLRVRGKGSAGGHNGLKSIIAHVGTDEFIRVRVGVGAKPDGWDLADYVLGRFPEGEQAAVRDAIGRAAEAVEMLVTEGLEQTMSVFNRKPAQAGSSEKNTAGDRRKKPADSEGNSPEEKKKTESGNVPEEKPADSEGKADGTEDGQGNGTVQEDK